MASLMSNSSFGKIPSGTTANRPASPAVGDQYYNGTLGYLEIYTSSGWKPAGGIPSGNTAGRPSSPSTGQPYFNGELQRLELYTGAQYGWQNIVAETPGVTGYSGTFIETNTTNTVSIVGTNFASGATASLIGTDGTEYVAQSTTVSSFTSITATFGIIPQNNEPYDIKVTNPSNLYGVYYDLAVVNDKPIWQTAAGSLGTIYTGQNISTQLTATDEENNSLTYSLVSGTLPTGLSLSSAGLISGTVSGSTSQTFNFTISVSDEINTAQNRIFSIVYVASPIVSGGTLSSDSTYYYRTFKSGTSTLSVSNASLTADALVIAGGGGGGAGGGGAGGVVNLTNLTLTPGSYNATVGQGGAANSNGSNSQFHSYTAAVGGGTAATNGGSGGGQNRDGNGAFGTGTSGQGNNGGSTAQGPYKGGSGGGGAGAAGGSSGGGNQSGEFGGPGGSGTNSYSSWLTAIASAMTGVSGWSSATSGGYIAGGGGGGTEAGARSGQASGGAGGGGLGNNGNVSGQQATAGIENTGGGGGGAGGSGGGFTAIAGPSAGGSGLIVIRYTRSQVGG